MKVVSPIALSVVALVLGCNDATQTGKQTTGSSDGSVATAPADYLQSAAQAQKKAVKMVDLVAINKAVEAFYVQEGRFPRTLEELEDKGYMRAVPVPPSGMKLNYDTNSGVVTMQKDLGNQ